jgi:hypothetical protein
LAFYGNIILRCKSNAYSTLRDSYLEVIIDARKMVMRMNRQAIFLPISEISREFIERSPNARAISARRVAIKSADIQVDL